MVKRWWIYCKEMFPLPQYILMGFFVFFEIYFVLLLNYDVTNFNICIEEVVCALTVFGFIFLLRILDDFKDYKTDLIEHPKRPLPSGRVKKFDLIILLMVLLLVLFLLNIVFMNNFMFFLLVILYGAFMSVWFSNSEKLKNNFIFMMFTHTPYLLFMNVYVISFAWIKYGLESISYVVVCLAFTIYFLGFIRGMAREIRIVKNNAENNIVSARPYDIRRYKKDALFVAGLAILDTAINIVLLWNLNYISVIILGINLIWFLFKIEQFISKPKKFKLLSKAWIYIAIQEVVVALTAACCLIIQKI